MTKEQKREGIVYFIRSNIYTSLLKKQFLDELDWRQKCLIQV